MYTKQIGEFYMAPKVTDPPKYLGLCTPAGTGTITHSVATTSNQIYTTTTKKNVDTVEISNKPPEGYKPKGNYTASQIDTMRNYFKCPRPEPGASFVGAEDYISDEEVIYMFEQMDPISRGYLKLCSWLGF